MIEDLSWAERASIREHRLPGDELFGRFGIAAVEAVTVSVDGWIGGSQARELGEDALFLIDVLVSEHIELIVVAAGRVIDSPRNSEDPGRKGLTYRNGNRSTASEHCRTV